MTWDSVHGFTGLLVFATNLLILVLLEIRHFLAVLAITHLRSPVCLEMMSFASWAWSSFLRPGVVMKSCVHIYRQAYFCPRCPYSSIVTASLPSFSGSAASHGASAKHSNRDKCAGACRKLPSASVRRFCFRTLAVESLRGTGRIVVGVLFVWRRRTESSPCDNEAIVHIRFLCIPQHA